MEEARQGRHGGWRRQAQNFDKDERLMKMTASDSRGGSRRRAGDEAMRLGLDGCDDKCGGVYLVIRLKLGLVFSFWFLV
ncbi:hypothetical protein YC2023_057024 [Brassica napus]